MNRGNNRIDELMSSCHAAEYTDVVIVQDKVIESDVISWALILVGGWIGGACPVVCAFIEFDGDDSVKKPE